MRHTAQAIVQNVLQVDLLSLKGPKVVLLPNKPFNCDAGVESDADGAVFSNPFVSCTALLVDDCVIASCPNPKRGGEALAMGFEILAPKVNVGLVEVCAVSVMLFVSKHIRSAMWRSSRWCGVRFGVRRRAWSFVTIRIE